jgi:hypothetical protein
LELGVDLRGRRHLVVVEQGEISRLVNLASWPLLVLGLGRDVVAGSLEWSIDEVVDLLLDSAAMRVRDRLDLTLLLLQ